VRAEGDHHAERAPPKNCITKAADAVLVRGKHAGARALERVPVVTVEVIVSRKKNAAALAECNRCNAAAGVGEEGDMRRGRVVRIGRSEPPLTARPPSL